MSETASIIVLLSLIVLFLAAPFLVVAMIWYLLLPVGFWETFATIFLVFLLFISVAIPSWLVALGLLVA